MTFLLSCLAVIFCVILLMNGYITAILIGGFIGSFFGIAGFGGAVSGVIPGALIGGLIAVAISKK